MEVIRLWFPWLLYETENVHNKKLKLQRKFGRGLEFKGLIIYSHEHFLLHVNIEMSGKSDLLWRNKSMRPNWTTTYLLHEMRSDWIIALVRNYELTVEKLLSLPKLPVTLQFSLYLIVLTFIMACWIPTYLFKVSLQNEGSFCWNKKVFGKCYVCFGLEAECWFKCPITCQLPVDRDYQRQRWPRRQAVVRWGQCPGVEDGRWRVEGREWKKNVEGGFLCWFSSRAHEGWRLAQQACDQHQKCL